MWPTSLAPVVFAAEDIVPCTYCCLLTTSLGLGTPLSVPKGFPLLLPCCARLSPTEFGKEAELAQLVGVSIAYF